MKHERFMNFLLSFGPMDAHTTESKYSDMMASCVVVLQTQGYTMREIRRFLRRRRGDVYGARQRVRDELEQFREVCGAVPEEKETEKEREVRELYVSETERFFVRPDWGWL